MGIVIHHQRFDIRFEQNLELLTQLAAKLAQDSAPAGDRAAQPSDSATHAFAFRRSA